MSLPTALTYLYTSQDEITDFVSSDGVDLRLDDDQGGTVSAGELTRLTTNAVNFATSRCNLYLNKRYAASRLYQSWQVHEWATTLGAVWLCRRRLNAVPKSLLDAAAEAVAEMEMVKNHELDLTEIPERQSDQPTLSNVTIDLRRRVKQVRVQRPISSKRASAIPQTIDHRADILASVENYP